MSDKVCPLCRQRVSEWWIASGKTTTFRHDVALLRSDDIVHNNCLQDLKMRKGEMTIAEIAHELGA